MGIWTLYITMCILLVKFSQCVHNLKSDDILHAVETSCVVAAVTKVPSTSKILEELEGIFKEENVTFGSLDIQGLAWPFNRKIKWANKRPNNNTHFIAFRKRKNDRTCLLPAPANMWTPEAEVYSGPVTLSSLVQFVNNVCDSFRTESGHVSVEGLHRLDILQNLFHVVHSSENIASMSSLFNSQPNPLLLRYQSWLAKVKGSDQHDTRRGDDENYDCVASQMDTCASSSGTAARHKHLAVCDRIHMPTKEEFFHEYVKRSKPVIIRGTMKDWAALSKWTTDYFKERYLHEEVHVKLTPNGDFEGVEKAELWEDHKTFTIPTDVKKQLRFPDLVVVRPATLNVNFSNFLEMLTNDKNHGKHRNYSAYLEYTSISQYFPSLEQDIKEPGFVKGLLKRRHLNIWLSDGYTLGRLHFDPFDNLLFQLSGQKEVTLFDPHDNTNLYEAHIPEALLKFNKTTKQFLRKGLLDSTSMVMSPVDIRNPDFQRFPQFADAYPMNCTINEGEALFMPAYWWHEVMSSPGQQDHRNLAVNFWYEPFFIKEFPCAECSLDVNPFYHHLL